MLLMLDEFPALGRLDFFESALAFMAGYGLKASSTPLTSCHPPPSISSSSSPGLSLAFGDTSGGFRRLIQIVFGLSIAFAASSFFLSFFSFGGGALI